VQFRTPTGQVHIPKPVYTGTVKQCVQWMMTKENEYPETYSMTVPLEAGFQKRELRFDEVKNLALP
jgi:hypothetical protein